MGILSGNPGAYLQPGEWGRNESGNFRTIVFNGTKREVDLMAGFYAQTLGLSYRIVESFNTARLEVYLPFNPLIDPTTDQITKWELFAQRVEKDLLVARVENPNTIALLSTSQVSTLRSYLLQPPDGTNIQFPTAAKFQLQGETNGALALQIFWLMQQGVQAFPVEAPTLRRTYITSDQYVTKAALTNVRKIISTSSLLTMESVPSNLLFSLPQESWSDPNPGSGASVPALNYGWYKHFPTIQEIALLKWQVVQEWEYGLWAQLLWGTPL